jgi:hypothetical protein
MRPAIVMPMHDPAGILFPHLQHAMPCIEETFARGYLSVTAVTLAQQPEWAAWLDGEPFFDVQTGRDASRPGDQFAELYCHAAAVSPPEQTLHLGFVDRVVYAVGSEYREMYLADVNTAGLMETPRLYHRSAAAWATHPANYRAMEGSITTAGEALLGRSLDFAWCYMTLSAGRLAQLMPAVTRSDMSMLAEMVVELCDELQVVEVDWLAWEDPYLLGRDAAALRRERDASPAEMRKRLGYVIPMLQVLASHNGRGA